jgi:hypothetical protein
MVWCCSGLTDWVSGVAQSRHSASDFITPDLGQDAFSPARAAKLVFPTLFVTIFDSRFATVNDWNANLSQALLVDGKGTPKEVLVVEDQLLVRMMAADALVDYGFMAWEAGDADEALQPWISTLQLA